MIYETVMYGVRCNRCHEALENSEGYDLFVDRCDADDEAQMNDWHSFDGEKHYCPSCVKYDEVEDEYKPLPPIPQEIWVVKRLVSACYGKSEKFLDFSEDEEHYRLSLYIPGRGELMPLALDALNLYIGKDKYRVEHQKTTGYNYKSVIYIKK